MITSDFVVVVVQIIILRFSSARLLEFVIIDRPMFVISTPLRRLESNRLVGNVINRYALTDVLRE